MKTLKIIAIVIGCGIFGVFLLSVVLHIVVNQRSEMTESQIEAMFDRAGGVAKVNQEAKIIFERLGTNESREIFGSDLTNFPVISSLGKPFFLQNKNNPPDWSAHIEIPFGTHYQRNFIFIFNSGSSIEFPYASNCIQVATNIFVGK
jgi:hypothetical protein